jgi:hypothetical protein
MNMVWIAYVIVVLVTALVIGRHLGKFTDAYTEMTGMMAGMTMGMLNGFLLGYGAAAATGSMFWGNLFGIFAGLGIGLYYGRPSGLMGIMDGSMGGVMGGSMGAMLATMLVFPTWAMDVTGVLLVAIYVAGMAGLVALIEQSAPEHAARHRVLPLFTRAPAVEAAEVGEEMGRGAKQEAAGSHSYRQGQGRNGRGRKQESPISWVGIAALVVILAVGGGWFATRGGAGNSGSKAGAYAVPSAAQLEGQATVAQPGADGRQTLDVVVNGSTMSYSPSVIEVKKGVPVHFNLSVEGRDPGCGRFVGVKGLGVHGIAVPGQVAPMDFTPTESGVFEINCSMNMMQRGYLLVRD